MDFNSSVLLVSAFLVGWLVGGFLLLGPQIVRQLKARRRQQRWLKLVSGSSTNSEEDRRFGEKNSGHADPKEHS